MRRRSGWPIVALVALFVTGITARSAEAGTQEPGGADGGAAMSGTVVIGSKNFTENRLLAKIMATLIEAETDIKVERRINLGGTTVVFSALRMRGSPTSWESPRSPTSCGSRTSCPPASATSS